MQTRRTFIKGTVIATTFATPIAAQSTLRVRSSAPTPVAIGFFDEELGTANNFASVLSTNGAEVQAIGRDVTGLWLRAMRETGTIVGLTRPGPLFCMQQMSPSSGRVVQVYRTIPSAETLSLRARKVGELGEQLARLAFEVLNPDAFAVQSGSRRNPLTTPSSHGSDELILWSANRARA